jgi:hypothetical protein
MNVPRNAEPSAECVIVFAGFKFAGGVRRRLGRFEALDPDGRKVGAFSRLHDALAALVARAATKVVGQ